jgi:hypothetical protein
MKLTWERFPTTGLAVNLSDRMELGFGSVWPGGVQGSVRLRGRQKARARTASPLQLPWDARRDETRERETSWPSGVLTAKRSQR